MNPTGYYPRPSPGLVPRFSARRRRSGSVPRVVPVGYGGHVPGVIAGNLHGAPWRELLTPRSAADHTQHRDALWFRAASESSPRRLPRPNTAAASGTASGAADRRSGGLS